MRRPESTGCRRPSRSIAWLSAAGSPRTLTRNDTASGVTSSTETPRTGASFASVRMAEAYASSEPMPVTVTICSVRCAAPREA